jgi:hypothetical protein
MAAISMSNNPALAPTAAVATDLNVERARSPEFVAQRAVDPAIQKIRDTATEKAGALRESVKELLAANPDLATKINSREKLSADQIAKVDAWMVTANKELATYREFVAERGAPADRREATNQMNNAILQIKDLDRIYMGGNQSLGRTLSRGWSQGTVLDDVLEYKAAVVKGEGKEFLEGKPKH